MSRFRTAALGLLCLAAAGCVEGEVVYTVNPDGSARVKVDVVSVVPPDLGFAPAPKKDPNDETLDDVLRRAIRPTLQRRNIAAWKDVSAAFLPDGKLRFSGTAYVKQVADFNPPDGISLFGPTYAAERGTDGSLKLVVFKKKTPDPVQTSPKRKPKTPDQIKKLTDAELDAYILQDLIEIQSTKSLLTAFLTDMKLKTTYVLPGDVTAAEGFARDGRRASFAIDGNKLLGGLNSFVSRDRAELRKTYRAATHADFLKTTLFEVGGDASFATVAKPGEPLFDFDKEVKEARAAYPELRKKFGFGDDLLLPTGDAPPPKK